MGSLAEQSHLEAVRTAGQRERGALVSITPPVALQAGQPRPERFCSEMKSTSWHSGTKGRANPTRNVKGDRVHNARSVENAGLRQSSLK